MDYKFYIQVSKNVQLLHLGVILTGWAMLVCLRDSSNNGQLTRTTKYKTRLC
jgi:hypothetical protein